MVKGGAMAQQGTVGKRHQILLKGDKGAPNLKKTNPE